MLVALLQLAEFMTIILVACLAAFGPLALLIFFDQPYQDDSHFQNMWENIKSVFAAFGAVLIRAFRPKPVISPPIRRLFIGLPNRARLPVDPPALGSDMAPACAPPPTPIIAIINDPPITVEPVFTRAAFVETPPVEIFPEEE